MYSIIKDQELPKLKIQNESKDSILRFLTQIIEKADAYCLEACHQFTISGSGTLGDYSTIKKNAIGAHQTKLVLTELSSIIRDA